MSCHSGLPSALLVGRLHTGNAPRCPMSLVAPRPATRAESARPPVPSATHAAAYHHAR